MVLPICGSLSDQCRGKWGRISSLLSLYLLKKYFFLNYTNSAACELKQVL